jgi:hypothetical protein
VKQTIWIVEIYPNKELEVKINQTGATLKVKQCYNTSHGLQESLKLLLKHDYYIDTVCQINKNEYVVVTHQLVEVVAGE